MEQLEEACAAGATRLLVDNQPAETVRAWAARARELAPGIEIEATGGITLANVRSYAEAGADFISIGALTHSVIAADLGIEVGLGSARGYAVTDGRGMQWDTLSSRAKRGILAAGPETRRQDPSLRSG